jgi:glycosyltransferase involved in cell wall biosynthesis
VRFSHRGGIKTYMYSLLEQLRRSPSDKDFTLLVSPEEGEFYSNDFHVIQCNGMNPSIAFLHGQMILPGIIRKYDFDMFHSLKNITLFFCRTRKVLTLHTAGPFLMPAFWRRIDGIRWRFLIRTAFQRMDHLITVSQTDRNHFLNHLGHSFADKTSVTYLAPNPVFTVVEDREHLESIKTKYDLPKKYILWVGTIYPFKNLEVLFRAFNFMITKQKVEHSLVICGEKGWFWSRTIETAHSLALGNRLVFLGSIPIGDLPGIYNLADLFVFPSIYESFGLPPLEAMACGTPVVASTGGALPEILSDAALFVDPYSIEQLADAMYSMLHSREMRAEFREKGFHRASWFSWKRCVEQTLDVYNTLLKQ